MIDIAVSFIEIKIRNDYMRTSMSYDVKLSLYDYATRTSLRGYADQRGALADKVFNTAQNSPTEKMLTTALKLHT